MNYSYSQMSLYQTCPRKYRYKYIDGWRERELSASLVFGRCFEDAIASLYRGQDPGARFFDQWEFEDSLRSDCPTLYPYR
jgi:hypothetical protein